MKQCARRFGAHHGRCVDFSGDFTLVFSCGASVCMSPVSIWFGYSFIHRWFCIPASHCFVISYDERIGFSAARDNLLFFGRCRFRVDVPLSLFLFDKLPDTVLLFFVQRVQFAINYPMGSGVQGILLVSCTPLRGLSFFVEDSMVLL